MIRPDYQDARKKRDTKQPSRKHKIIENFKLPHSFKRRNSALLCKKDRKQGHNDGKRSKRRKLSEKQCTPCCGGVEPLGTQELTPYLQQLADGWDIIESRKLEKTFKFKNFREALDFTNRVGQLAEQQQHHPDITLSWGKVKIELWTHKIGGLHENDFILAAEIDRILVNNQSSRAARSSYAWPWTKRRRPFL
ncbi:MAG: 4a-hydroxytetrahydrobiopterin dehydratase [Planctomycetes bacterium]|nr:4a-hydroxytetrahydrobiopterin dehydratase [Planctomycetota bacterium]